MTRITNLSLLCSAILVAALTWLEVVENGSSEISLLLKFGATTIFFALAVHLILRRLNKNEVDRTSVLLQPVSDKISHTIINSVVLIFVCAILIIVFVILKVVSSIETTIVAIAICFAALGYGWYLRKSFSSDTLLMYGVSFLGALILILIFVNDFPVRLI